MEMSTEPAIVPSSSGTLFLIWSAIRGGRNAPADESGLHDDRQQVRQPGEEVVVDAWKGVLDAGQKRTQVTRRRGEADRYTDRLGPHEEERAAERAQRCPAPKDHGGQGNEPPAGSHVVLEGASGLECKIGAGQAGKHTTQQNVTIAKPDYIDADGVRRLRVLPNGTRPQTPTRAEEQDLDDNHQYDSRQGNWAHCREHLEQPADARQVHEPSRRP